MSTRLGWLVACVIVLGWLVWYYIVLPHHLTWQMLATTAGLQLIAIPVVVYAISLAGDAIYDLVKGSADTNRNKTTGKLLFCTLIMLPFGLWVGVPTLFAVHWEGIMHLHGNVFGLNRVSDREVVIAGRITLAAWLFICHEAGTLLVWWQKRSHSRRSRASAAEQSSSTRVSQYV